MIIKVDTDDPITISPVEAAGFLLAWLERNGASVRLNDAQQLRVNLDGVPDMTEATAERISRLIFSVRDELRDLLIARDAQTVH